MKKIDNFLDSNFQVSDETIRNNFQNMMIIASNGIEVNSSQLWGNVAIIGYISVDVSESTINSQGMGCKVTTLDFSAAEEAANNENNFNRVAQN